MIGIVEGDDKLVLCGRQTVVCMLCGYSRLLCGFVPYRHVTDTISLQRYLHRESNLEAWPQPPSTYLVRITTGCQGRHYPITALGNGL